MPATMTVRLQTHLPLDVAKVIQHRAVDNCRSTSRELEWLLVQALKAQGHTF
jgi:hypothetical protein